MARDSEIQTKVIESCDLMQFLPIIFALGVCLFLVANTLYVRQTVVALGMEVEDKMPLNEYYEYFGPDYTLHVAPSNMENKNSKQLLEEIRRKLLDYLSKIQHAPSVQFQERPPDTEIPEVCSAAMSS